MEQNQDNYRRLRNLLFIDVETVPIAQSFDELPEAFKPLWLRKARYFIKGSKPQLPTEEFDRLIVQEAEQKFATKADEEFLREAKQLFDEKAGLYPEFSKIITLGAGYFYKRQRTIGFRVKAFQQELERDLLEEFKGLIQERFDEDYLRFVAHNGKEFDYPFMCRRMLVNSIVLPKSLRLYGMRPWQVPHLDTQEMWRFGDFHHRVSLEMLLTLFGLPNSKADMNGSEVQQVYYQQKDMKRIAAYCRADVIATARVYLHMQVMEPLKDELITEL